MLILDHNLDESKNRRQGGLVGGLADLGYFIFLDLGGFVKFAPGAVMTLFSSAAVVISIWTYFSSRP